MTIAIDLDRFNRLEKAVEEHEFKLAAFEARDGNLVDLRNALEDVHKSLAGTVAEHTRGMRGHAKQLVTLGTQMQGLSSSMEAMRLHVTKESETRIKDMEREKLQRESLAGAMQEASTSLEAATPEAHARQMMMASTLAVSVIFKNVAEDLSHNAFASWLVVGAVLLFGFIASRKRKSVP